MIHPSAEVCRSATVGEGTQIWNEAQVRANAKIGSNCIVGKGVYLDEGVLIGDNVKIQNRASIYLGAVIESGAFIGPHVCLTNDKTPRSITVGGDLKGRNDWEVRGVLVRRCASIGAGSIILPGVVVGEFAMVGAGSVVTRDVPDHGLVQGNPARLVGFVCECGGKLTKIQGADGHGMICSICNTPMTKPARSTKEIL